MAFLKQVHGLQLNERVYDLIQNRIRCSSAEPYTFFVQDVNAVGGKLNNAYATFQKN